MKITRIKYPDGCRLEGWKKIVFEQRLKQTLGSSFYVSELDRCRAEILGLKRDDERYHQLNVFHCESFEDMTSAQAQGLVEKTAQYVGVEITAKHGSRPGRMRGPGFVPMMGGFLIGAIGGGLVSAVIAAKNIPEPSVSSPPSVAGLLPLAPPIFDDPVTDPIFSITARTTRPGSMARTLARTVRDDVGEYEVALTVTPITSRDEAEK